ncbi:hypothetical protein GPECTOR_47g353 [Gonium pectorale]|uniref:Uncharacterized protein n=1 Tax=Gonium pectorale TaxID=33097 RepID=A0A150G8D1_GONPE|nr:hypothetical protein GPECTOR_47g353 [Gonium pectorale]|eukprot:KXZ46078.1 hypothetical protein GPECTOR_47g353 [Gonium pectorale]
MAQQQPMETPAEEHWSSRVWPQLFPELAERIVGCLDRNNISATFRHLNKATAKHFSGPQHTIIRLMEPVPPHAFAAHWLAPGAMRGLTLERRKKLVRLVAASGVVQTVELALQAAGFTGAAAEAFKAAAGAGQLPVCQWLWDHSRFVDGLDAFCAEHALATAARGGHRHVCEWLLTAHHRSRCDGAIRAAYCGAHMDLAEWLLEQYPAFDTANSKGMRCVARGCDLATLQRAWLRFRPALERERAAVLAAAAGSPTSDWAAKVEWLEAQGCIRTTRAAVWAAGMPNNDNEALAHLTWLRGRGYPADVMAVVEAGRSGNMAALQCVLAEVPADANEELEDIEEAVLSAAEAGHLAAVQALQAAGWPINGPSCAARAAEAGHLHALAWLLEGQWAQWAGPVVLDAELFSEAARSASVELLAWLRQRGCSWDGKAYGSAARAGCQAALEWLAEQGCPMPDSGEPYLVACRNRDLATLRCLRRLGVPWGPDGRVLLEYTTGLGSMSLAAVMPMLLWVLQEGYPVDREVVEEWLARCWHSPRECALLREHLGRRQQSP